jgi:cytochrome c
MEPFMGSHKFSNPIDMEFSVDGDLYVLEYGTAWFTGNPDARLVRIEYTAGNRKPEVKLKADKTQGAVPFTVHFTSKGTTDWDKDAVSYEWIIFSPEGKSIGKFSTPDLDFNFEKPGVYKVELSVNDGKGGKSISTLEVQAGNEPPNVELKIVNGNSGFFFPGQPFDYEVVVNDKEDGSTLSGGISSEAVSVTVDYLPEGFDKAIIVQGHKFADGLATASFGKALIDKSDCNSCHKLDQKSVGPTFTDVSKKYANDPNAMQYLTHKIKQGGGGVWGDVMMAAHPSLPDQDISEMVKYILGLSQKPSNSLPLKGRYTTSVPKGQSDQGLFILRAAYTDKGANDMPGIRTEQILVLRNASLSAASCDELKDIMKMKPPGLDTEIAIAQKDGAWLAFKQMDLSGIKAVTFLANAPSNYGMMGGSVEVRLGSPDGTLIGTSSPITPSEMKPNTMPVPSVAVAPLKPTQGKQDVYFICKSPQGGGPAGLFVLMRLIFQGSGKQNI